MERPSASVDFPGLGFVEAAAVPFDALTGFADEDFESVWSAFLLSCAKIAKDDPGLRPGVAPGEALVSVCVEALNAGRMRAADIRAFIETRFEAFRVRPGEKSERGFLTGYYEPVISGAWQRSAAFSEPLLARPPDLVTLRPGDDWGDLDKRLSGATRGLDGALKPYAARSEIEVNGDRYTPLVWVRDAIEAFMIQVQGSATIRVGEELVRMTYAGRNGRPYTSIGRILIERGDIPQSEMSLARLKQWARDHGQTPGEAGRALLWRNESFVFFEIDRSADRRVGPIGAAGTPLSPLRSIAVDRTIWPYGLPFWINAELPWRSDTPTAFRRLMVAQDTGSAIVGSARADLYIGAGGEAGVIAGQIRHPADFIVLLPRALGLRK